MATIDELEKTLLQLEILAEQLAKQKDVRIETVREEDGFVRIYFNHDDLSVIALPGNV